MGRKVRGSLPQVKEKLNPTGLTWRSFGSKMESSKANRNRTKTTDIESKACHPSQTNQKYGLHLDPSHYRGMLLQQMPQGHTSSKLILAKFAGTAPILMSYQIHQPSPNQPSKSNNHNESWPIHNHPSSQQTVTWKGDVAYTLS